MFNDYEDSILESIENTRKYLPKMKIFGIGGAGGNIVDRLVSSNFLDDSIDLIAINTDLQRLETSLAPNKLSIGNSSFYGAGGKIDIGKQAAIESIDDIKAQLIGVELVLLISGMGGGTGTGASPIIAKVAKDLDILTISIVTVPFLSEGSLKLDKANIGIKALKDESDAIIIIDNEKSLQQSKLNMNNPDIHKSFFKFADDAIIERIETIYNLIYKAQKINIDFADIKNMFQDSGLAFISTGKAKGQNAVIKAVKLAVKSDILKNNTLQGASSIVIMFKLPYNFTESTEPALAYIRKFANRTETKMGITETDSNILEITIIATKFLESTTNTRENTYKQYIESLETWVPPLDQELMDRPAITLKKTNKKPIDTLSDFSF